MVYYTQILNLVFKKSHVTLSATVDSLQIMGCIYNSDGKIVLNGMICNMKVM